MIALSGHLRLNLRLPAYKVPSPFFPNLATMTGSQQLIGHSMYIAERRGKASRVKLPYILYNSVLSTLVSQDELGWESRCEVVLAR